MKKLIALLLALCMVFALSACGGSQAPAATEDPAAEAPAAEPGIEPVTLTIYSPGNENSVPTKTLLSMPAW